MKESVDMNLKEIAVKSITLSELYNTRTQITTDEVLGKPLTIAKVDVVSTDMSSYAVCIFNEYPDRFYNAGLVLTKVVKNWISCLGSIEAVNESLNETPVQIVLNLEKTKNKNNVVTVSIL